MKSICNENFRREVSLSRDFNQYVLGRHPPHKTSDMWITDEIRNFFDSLHSEENEDVEQFMDRNYFYLFQITSIYLKMNKKYRVLSSIYFILTSSVLVYCLVNLINTTIYFSHSHFILFTYTLHTLLVSMASLCAVFILLWKRNLVVSIHKAAMGNFYDYEEPQYDEEVAKMRDEMFRTRNIFMILMIFMQSIGGLLCFYIEHIVDGYFGNYDFKSISDVASVNLPFPFVIHLFSSNSVLLYYFNYFTQLFQITAVILSIPSVEYMFVTIGLNIILQLKILSFHLEKVEERAVTMYSELYPVNFRSCQSLYASKEFAHCYKVCLKKCFIHHQMIIRYFDDYSVLTSNILLLWYLVLSTVLGFNLLITDNVLELPGVSINALFMCLGELGSLYVGNAIGQTIKDKSSDLRFKMYSIKWYYCDSETKRCLMIFQARTLKPLVIVAGGLIPIEMNTFARAINCAYTYYNVAKAINKDG